MQTIFSLTSDETSFLKFQISTSAHYSIPVIQMLPARILLVLIIVYAKMALQVMVPAVKVSETSEHVH